MSASGLPVFGRRRAEAPPPAPEPGCAAEVAASPTASAREGQGLPPMAEAPVAEPALRPQVGATLLELRTLCLARLDPAGIAGMTPERLTPEVERLLSEVATEQRMQLNAREQRQLAVDLVDDMLGLGPLEPLLDDETISDIMVNGPDKIFVETRGKVVRSAARFRDAAHAANIAQRIAAAVGRRVDEASPMVDARLLDGSRVNIIFPPLALDGPCISIRKFSRRSIDLAKLVEFGSMSQPMARVLEIASACRLNIVISGGTGSGKTTLMNALSRPIDPGERIITIEDAAELQLQQPHIVRLETRPLSLAGRGEVNQRDLVRNALRMRPDRIIIGEVRGAEAFDMLQAMNTGHDGSMSTVHANTTRDALTRIENMVQMASLGLVPRAIKTQIASALDLVIQVERHRDGKRRVTQITEVQGLEGEVFVLNDVFQYEFEGEDSAGGLRGRWRISRTRPAFHQRLSYFGLDRQWAEVLDGA